MNIEQAWALKVGDIITEGLGDPDWEVIHVASEGIIAKLVKIYAVDNYDYSRREPRVFRFGTTDFVGWVKK